MNDYTKKIRDFFKYKAASLLLDSKQAQDDHPSLTGRHREKIIIKYLKSILPKKYSVGEGIIYGTGYQKHFKSNELDIVVWDSFNYPSLTLDGYSLYFPESIRLIIEVKTRWSQEEFEDIKNKTRLIKSYVQNQFINMEEKIQILENEMNFLKNGNLPPTNKTIETASPIKVASICFLGGHKFTKDCISQEEISRMENEWPDIMLFLEAERVILKSWDDSDDSNNIGKAKGRLEFIEAKDVSLLLFIEAVIRASLDSIFVTHLPPFSDFLPRDLQIEALNFPMLRSVPGIYWH